MGRIAIATGLLILLGTGIPANPQATPEPLPTFDGAVRALSKKTLRIATSEDNIVEFDLTRKTRFLDGSKEVKASAIHIGDRVSVDAKQTLDGRLEAVYVRLNPKPREVTPQAARQGDTLHIRTTADAAQARMNGRTIPLFAQEDGSMQGLMPIPATETPGQYKAEFLGKNGAVLRTADVTVRNARFAAQNVVISKTIAELKATPDEHDAVAAFRNAVSGVRYWSEPLGLPVNGCMTSPFGVRRLLNGKATGDYHGGIDQRSPAGRPVRAIAGGMVRLVRPFTLHGNTVAIDHGQGLESMYLHLSRFAVAEGAQVKKGDVIGYVGSTGRSTAPHLHWLIYVNQVSVNPAQWVKLTPCGQQKRQRRV